MDDFLILLIIIFVLAAVMTAARNARKSNGVESASSTAKKQAILEGSKAQIVEDIKATQTGRIVDQVSILEDLDAISPGHRQFCELTGTSEQTSGVTAPYSKRQVAYYDVRCYKIERVNGRDIETLVAQERSIEPFYFTDASCDTKVYVALDSFGSNCILVNSMNHIEGPNSDFSKAISTKTGSVSGARNASYMVDNVASNLHQGLRNVWEWTIVAPQHAYALFNAAFGFNQPALAAAGFAGSVPRATESKALDNFRFAGRPSGHGGGRPPMSYSSGGHRPQGSSRPQSSGKQNVRYVTTTVGGIPMGLDSFLDLGGKGMGSLQHNPYLGGPKNPYYRGSGDDFSTAILNIGLGALLASMSAPTSTQSSNPAYTQTNNTFMGYRIVEDVVPLNYPVYCLGEIYKNGTDIYMGKSIGSVSSSYYFATKLEAELLEHLK